MAEELLQSLAASARAGLRVTLESNLAPAIKLYGGADGGGSAGIGAGIARLMGIRVGLVVRSARGEELARIGDPAPFSPLRAGLVAGTFIAGVYLLALALRRK